MYDSPFVLGTPIYPEDLEIPRIPGRKPKGELDENFYNLLRAVASGQDGKIHLQSVWKNGLPPIRTVIEPPDGPLRVAVPIDLNTGSEIDMTEEEREALILPALPADFTVSRNSRVECIRILRFYGWGGRLARRLRHSRWEWGPCPECSKRRAPWDSNCQHCGANWEGRNTTIGDGLLSPTVRRLLDQIAIQDVKLLNERKPLVQVEHVYRALNMTVSGTQVVLPEMAAMIDEAVEFEREQFYVSWCDYGRHVYFRNPSRGKACGFHMRVRRQRSSDYEERFLDVSAE